MDQGTFRSIWLEISYIRKPADTIQEIRPKSTDFWLELKSLIYMYVLYLTE